MIAVEILEIVEILEAGQQPSHVMIIACLWWERIFIGLTRTTMEPSVNL